jgi:threonine/homoserine/homoserine lactone efflux protein
MDLATFFSLAGAAFIFGISPGPGTLAALSVSTTQGLRSGLILGAGEAVGDVVYLTIGYSFVGIFVHLPRACHDCCSLDWCWISYLSWHYAISTIST